MRFLVLATAVFAAMFAGFTGTANASWKGGVFNTNTSTPVAVAPRRQTRAATRPAPRARSTTRASRTAGRQRASTRSRTVGRGGSLRGLASYYWQPQRVASGGWFNPNALTAAHKTLPFGTRVRVTNLRNGRSVVVRINDRGPYIRGRIIDLSQRAATVVGMRQAGVVPVSVQIL